LFVALDRIKRSVGGWAEIDLHQDFMTGRVKSALRYLLSDDGTKQVWLLLRPGFWSQLRIIGMGPHEPVLVEGNVEGQPLESSPAWAFFARTVDLDKRYRVVSAAGPPDVAQSPPPDFVQPPPRRPGPPPKLDQWFPICGEVARRCIDPKAGRVRVPKNESALARDVLQWCEDQDLGQPADSDMREAVRRVCAALRSLQK
jgi:hypothetical protein